MTAPFALPALLLFGLPLLLTFVMFVVLLDEAHHQFARD